jgi:hypothetical protein
MEQRPVGYRDVQPEWRERILLSLPANGDFAKWEPSKLAGTHVEWAEGEGEDFDEFSDWIDDRLDWLRIALKELEFLGHVERRQDSGTLRLTEAGAVVVLELKRPKAVAA